MIEVNNLATGETLTIDTNCALVAVRMAWQHANGKRPTIRPGDDKAPTVLAGKRSVACGDWCALCR
jgi:hypothetical protein